jgi:5-(aminomethyl)-3-furanmethanol phosphate kinase
MSDHPWTIVKVGGSLYDLPDLRDRLSAWLDCLDAEHVLLVPGGGVTADAIRMLDGVHHLGEEASHWLAIQALSINARFLQSLLPNARLVAHLDGSTAVCILDAYPFFQADENRSDHLPHGWDVTSDSLALRVAVRAGARELILLKSVDEGVGVVDGYFAEAVQQVQGLRVRLVNLRTWPRSGPRGR